MARRFRPWLATVLAFVAAGLGHVYLREWRRAALWFVTILASGVVFAVLFGDPASEEALTDPSVLLPLLVTYVFSAIDAYAIANRLNDEHEAGTPVEASGASAVAEDSAAATVGSCPHCGRDVDPELDFCTWCTEPLPGRQDDATEEEDRGTDPTRL